MRPNGPDSGLVVIGAAENGLDLVKAPTSALASHYFPLFWHFSGLGTCHKLTQHLSVPLLQLGHGERGDFFIILQGFKPRPFRPHSKCHRVRPQTHSAKVLTLLLFLPSTNAPQLHQTRACCPTTEQLAFRADWRMQQKLYNNSIEEDALLENNRQKVLLREGVTSV